MPINPPPPCEFWLKYSTNAVPFRPGMVMNDITRQMNNTPSVNKIRDFNSGILKQLRNVL
jgi:hypothetical protein